MANPIRLLNPAGDALVEGHVTAKQNLRLYSDTGFLGTLDHAITAARTWTLPDVTGALALTADITTHEAAADPHTGYRLESADHSHQSTGAQAGKLDHGLALDGLSDDDHTQYGLKSGTLAQFAATTSAELRGVLSDEKGTGVALFNSADSATLTNPIIANIAPGTDFTLTQNSVAALTSIATGAIVNTLYIKEGEVGIGVVPGSKLDVAGSLRVRGNSTNGTFTAPGQLAVKNAASSPYWSFHQNDGSIMGYVQCSTSRLTWTDQAGAETMVLKDGRMGISTVLPGALLDANQLSTTGAIPVLLLNQADVDQPLVELVTTIGTGNAIEAVGAKVLTTTHFVMVKIPGGLTRYFPVGTIA